MRAGGWTDVSGFYQSNSAWWYNSLNQTWTWVNAHQFWWFTYTRPRGTTARYISDLRIGDSLEIDFDRDGFIDHNMVVTLKNSSDISLSYHSNNTLNEPFQNIYSRNPNAAYYGWIISSSIK